MAVNCPPPGDSLPIVEIEEITIQYRDQPEEGVERGVLIQLDLTARHVVENPDEPSWLDDEMMKKYLNLRVIQVRNAEADRFITGVKEDLVRRRMLGHNFRNINEIGNHLLRGDQLYTQGGLIDYAGYRYEHRDASNRGKNSPQGVAALRKVRDLTAMMTRNPGGIIGIYPTLYFLSPVPQNERVNFRTPRFDDEPPFVDVAYPGGVNGRADWAGPIYLSGMVYPAFGAPTFDRPPYKQLGVPNAPVMVGETEVSSQGLVTIYDKPLVNDENEFLLEAQETINEGNETIVTARIPSIFFGHPDNTWEREGDPVPYGDKILTDSDISYLSYHAFFYVDINRMLEDMELDDE